MVDPYLNKLSQLLTLIKSVDGRRITSPMSDYGTVSDIFEKLKNGRNLTSSQLNLIKDINKLYTRRYDKL